MEQGTLQQLEQQKNIWNKYSGGWKKWEELMTAAMSPTTEKVIELLSLAGDEKILDVASGPGEPGLTISRKLPRGSVNGTDLSENMVAIANERAQILGITNYHSQSADACHLPFPDNNFDHVVSRFGIMFFPDLKEGLHEMIRVLKPGGSLTVLVWAAPDLNPFMSIMGRTIVEKLGIPSPPPDGPGIFRCAKPGLAADLLKEAGLLQVKDMSIAGHITYDSLEQFWELSSDVAGPIMEALKNAPSQKVEETKSIILDKVNRFITEGKVKMPWTAILATGIKRSSTS
jgi:ubiquinone/menaquinone biosynthesis C-methylase UbiE